MHNPIHTLPTLPVLTSLLERVVPGTSLPARRLREQLLAFVASPTAKAVLLRGPIGVGKSTLARVIALLKRIAPLRVEEAQRLADFAKFDGPNRIALNYLASWYVELSLTGLVESLADAQLFGVTKNAYTGAGAGRPGVFERAARGLGSTSDPSAGARLTGGIVFLDEIGELSAPLQAKLLPVLSGGAFYRVGSEGVPNEEINFRGVTITASWRELNAQVLRPDLLSRVAAYVIDVPSIAERMDDFDALLDVVEWELLRATRAEIENALKVEALIDRDYWTRRLAALAPLPAEVRTELRKYDWSRLGNLRGLANVVEQILTGGQVPDHAIAAVLALRGGAPVRSGGDGLLERLLERPASGRGLVGHVTDIEDEQRRTLRDRLRHDHALKRRLADHLGIPMEKFAQHLRDLVRSRTTQSSTEEA